MKSALLVHAVRISIVMVFCSGAVIPAALAQVELRAVELNAVVADAFQDITYSSLRALAEAGRLTPGKKYRITDFRTRHTIQLTREINTAPLEALIVTALTGNALLPSASSETYPHDIIEYELVNSSPDSAFDRGRITFRRDTRKNISSYEDWRSVKYRRGLNAETGRYTELTEYSKGYLDRFPFNDSPDPKFVRNVHIDRAAGGALPDIVIGTGKSTFTSDILIGQGSTRITIGDNSDTIEIAQVNGSITIGDGCTHIRIGVCSDYVVLSDRSAFINIGSNSSQIAIRDSVANSNIGDNVLNIVVGDGTPLSGVYVGHGVSFDPAPVIKQPGFLESHMSTIPAVLEITGTESLDLTGHKHAGVVVLNSKNKSELIKLITKKLGPNETDFPIEIRPSAGLKLSLNGTPIEAISADGQIVLKNSLILNGDTGDTITLKKKKIGNHSVYVETARSIY